MTRAGRPLPGVTYNPYLPSVREDPYPTYRRLGAADPVHFNPFAGMWFLTRHEDCAAVLKDPRFSAQLAQQARPGVPDVPDVARSMLSSDPPEHARLRAPLSGAFSPRRIRLLRARVDEVAEHLLEARPEPDLVDVVADLAEPLAARILAELLAVPEQDLGQFQRWARAASAILDPLAPPRAQKSGEAATEELEGYLSRIAAERRLRPADDLIGTLVATVNRADGLLTWPEMLMACDLLVVGGYEPAVHLIGNGMSALARDPRALQLLWRDPTLLEIGVEELLRYDGPIQLTARVAREDVEIGSKRVAGGQVVVLLLGAANRDPSVFAEPDRLDLRRSPNPHLAFGAGIHYCLGAGLARVMAQGAIRALARRFARLEPISDPAWLPTVVPRGLERLPLRVWARTP